MVNQVFKNEVVTFPISRESSNYRTLLDGLREKRPWAAAALYDRFAKKIDKSVWRMLGPDGDHDDIVQQIFAQIFLHIHQLKNPDALEQWISAITFNVIKKELKRNYYRRVLFYRSDCHTFVDRSTASKTSFEARVTLRHAFEILNTMKPLDRMIYIMKFIEGSSNAEISATSGLSLATVKRRIIRSRNIFLKRAKRDAFLASMFEVKKDGR